MNYEGFRNDQAGCQFAEVEVDTETGIVRVTMSWRCTTRDASSIR